MSNLLQVVKMQAQAMQKKSTIPVMVEFQVNPDCAPFLVSGSKEMIWVDEAHPGDIVKAAPRRGVTPGELFLGVVNAVAKRGIDAKWGNVHPFTNAGVSAAIEYVSSFDLDNLEILVPRVRDEKNKEGAFQRPDWLSAGNYGMPVRPTGWLPDNCAVVVPRDREFVGMIGHLGAGIAVIVVHNAARGIAVARGDG